jgi:photosystem II stability/assembly factor-like uncharacterized protein
MRATFNLTRCLDPVCRIGSLRSILFLLVLAVVHVPFPSMAQSWIPVGVPGGNVRELAADPRDTKRLYLGTADGILYRSKDGGHTWERLDPGFPRRGCSLDEIVVDRRGVVTIGFWEVHGRGGGVARSKDGGETFEFARGIEGQSVRALAVAPSNPRIIVAGTLAGVFLSQDSGKKWKRISPEGHPDLRNFGSLAIDPLNPRVIYAGTWHLSWKTQDEGATWTRMDQGMIDDSDVMTLTLEPGEPETVYATACTGIYRSRDAGSTWTKLLGIPYSSRRTRAFALGHRNPNVLLAGTTQGLWISGDGGQTWRRSTKKQVINAVVSQPDGTVLLGTEEEGVLRSKDSGKTWVTSNTGFSERLVSKLLFDPRGERVFMAAWGTRGGVYAASNVGGPWKRIGEGLEGRQVLSLALQGDRILAGTDDGVYVRPQRAETWNAWNIEGTGSGLRVTELRALPGGSLLAATSQGLWMSPDGGSTWTHPAAGHGEEVLGLAVSDRNPDVIVAATRAGFFRSKNGGETWSHVSTPLRVTPHALAFSPVNDRVLFATTTRGLYRSKDQGSTWKRVGGGIPPNSDLTGIVIHPDGRTIHVSDFSWGGIFRSVDGGSTWDRLPTEGLGSDRVWSLTVDPSAPHRLLAAASAGGLHLFVPSRGATIPARTASTAAGAAQSELAPSPGE